MKAVGGPSSAMTFWWKLALAATSAALIVFSFPPFDVVPLLFVTLVPLLAVIERSRPRRAFLWGWLTGIGVIGVGFYFIYTLLQVFGGIPKPVALGLHLLFSAYQGIQYGIFAALLGVVRRSRRVPLALAAPVCWVAVEFVCREIFIFPYYLGNAAYTFTAFIQIADLFGGFGVTAAVVLVNTAIYELLDYALARRAGGPVTATGEVGPAGRFPLRTAVVAAAVFAFALVYGAIRISQVDALAASRPTIRIGLVEADIGIFQKARPELVRDNMLIHQNLSRRLERDDDVDLIVWPETAVNIRHFYIRRRDGTEELHRGYLPRDVTWIRPSEAELVPHYQDDRRLGTSAADLSGIQRGFHTPILFGVLTARPVTESERETLPPRPNHPAVVGYNSSILLDAEGRVLGMYDKNVLLVFGEYVPLSTWLWKTFGFNFFELVPAAGSIARGTDATVMALPFTTDDGEEIEVRIGPMICYEDIIAEYALGMVEQKPNIFINVINDGWFQDSSASYHHNAFSVLRAVEHHIPLVRSTNTGISSFVDPVGRIVAETELTVVGEQHPEVLVEDVPIMPPPSTLYSRIGDVLGWLCLIGSVVLVLVGRRQDGEPEVPEEGGEGEGSAASASQDADEGRDRGSSERQRRRRGKKSGRGSRRRR